MDIIDKDFTAENYQATLNVDKIILMQGLDESSRVKRIFSRQYISEYLKFHQYFSLVVINKSKKCVNDNFLKLFRESHLFQQSRNIQVFVL
jgi:hypothetical protein